MKNTFWNRVLLIAIDAILIAVAAYLAYLIRFVWFYELRMGDIPSLELYSQIVIFIILLWIALFKISNIYDQRFGALIDEIFALAGGIIVGVISFLGLLYLYRQFGISRQVIVYIGLISFVLMVSVRLAIAAFSRWMRKRGFSQKKILIIGMGETAQALANKIKNNSALGYQLAGFIDDKKISEAQKIIRESKPDEVILATENLNNAQVLDLITECELDGLEFKLVPGILELLASRVDTDEIGGIPLMAIKEIQWTGFKAVLKRIFDLVSSILLIIILIPVWLIVPVLIKLTSAGPVVFVQKRVGKNEKQFQVYKFRSMYLDAEKRLAELEGRSEAKGHLFKIKEDPRITSVGKWIRKFSIDELPQIFNVLFGTMSLVGPRPPLPTEVGKYNSWQKKRLRVSPGITGLWQVSGRSELPFDDMVRLDLYYIENWSLWLDIKILFRTIPAVLFAKGAY